MQRLGYLLVISGALLLSPGNAALAQQAGAPPPAVVVAPVVAKDVTPSFTFNGRVEAVDTVELRARVDGYVEQRLFKDGADVRAGDVLIVLEKAPYQAQIDGIRGQITSAEGALRLSEIEVDRQTKLVKTEAVAQQRLDVAEANQKQSLGALQNLQASLRRAELDLGYTDIKAPMDGRVGRFGFSVGDYVTPSSGTLAEIVTQDPIYVTFPVSARQLLELRKQAEADGRDLAAVQMRLRLPDGSIYDQTGTPDFLDVQVDQTTDSVTVRAVFPNPQGWLVDKQLVGVIVERAEAEQALVIPQASVAVDQAGTYVLAVGRDGTVEQRRVRLGAAQGSDVVVADGLKDGEQVIVEGLQKVRPGQVVQVSRSETAAQAVR